MLLYYYLIIIVDYIYYYTSHKNTSRNKKIKKNFFERKVFVRVYKEENHQTWGVTHQTWGNIPLVFVVSMELEIVRSVKQITRADTNLCICRVVVGVKQLLEFVQFVHLCT